VSPDSRDATSCLAEASDDERRALGLDEPTRVIRITRTRMRDATPFIRETIALPEPLFPGFVDRPEVANTLYDLFQKEYGVLVMRTEDRLSAAAADAETATALAIPLGTPLLRIARIAFALDHTPVEWRVSLCHLDRAHYLARTK